MCGLCWSYLQQMNSHCCTNIMSTEKRYMNIPEQKIMLAIYLASPEVENDRRALNVSLGMRRATKEGRWIVKAPLGYSNKRDENNRPVIVPSQYVI